MKKDHHLAPLEQAIRKYVRSSEGKRDIDKAQRELLKKLAKTFLSEHAKVRSTLQVRGTVTPPGGVDVAFSDLLVESVVNVIADEKGVGWLDDAK